MNIHKTPKLLGVLFFLCTLISQAQINGTARSTSSEAIAFATVILKKAQDSSIVSYTQTNEQGFYTLKTPVPGVYNLTFSSLSYGKKLLPLMITPQQDSYTIDVVMEESQLELNEIIINADLPIRIKNDTIIIDAKAFATGNEQVLEDLLKKIPGLTVESDGTVKVGNQEVEKIMIEGDDFFERGYKMLTKNMPASPLKNIEILQRYSNNKLLKGVEESDKIALNLTLDDDAKQQWFGNIDVSQDVGLQNFYQGRFNLMSFGKKNKFYFLGNANTIGMDATGDISHLMNTYRFNEPGNLGGNVSINKLLGLNGGVGNFKSSRSDFNNDQLLSLNAIFNPSKALKIKTLGFFNWDSKDFFRNSTASFFANGTNFTNVEDYTLRNTDRTTFGKVQLNYDFSKNATLESVTTINDGSERAGAALAFNDVSTLERLTAATSRYEHVSTYTNRRTDAKVFLATARVVHEESPQEYDVNQYFFDDLFPSTAMPNAVNQQVNNRTTYAGLQAHYLDRKKNGNLLELRVGNQYRVDGLDNVLRFRESGITTNEPEGYQNRTKYTVNDLFAQGKYLVQWSDWKVTSMLDMHFISNELNLATRTDSQNVFFLNPSVAINYELNRDNRFGFSASQNRTNAGLLEVFDQYVLTGFRSFNRGTGRFNQLDASNLNLNYQLGNWTDRFFATANLDYRKDHDFFSTNSVLAQNFSQTTVITIKNRESLSLNLTADYYFKNISSNLKLRGSVAQSNFKNVINDSDLRDVEQTLVTAGVEMRSAFSGFFNYHVGTSYDWTQVATSQTNSFLNNRTFLDLSFNFTERITAIVKGERFYFGNINEGDNTYYFLDLDARYSKEKSPWTFGITARNLTNTEQFRTSFINDVASSTISFRLLPRFVLFQTTFRF